MNIAIDASRAAVAKWGGQENYAYYLINALAQVDQRNHYTLYTSREPVRPFPKNERIQTNVMPFPRLWTQVRLAAETFRSTHDVLFMPVHAIPYIRRSSLKTVVTIHDLAFERNPEYHRFLGSLYLRQYMRYSAKHATHLIAVSEVTKRDLMELYRVPEEKITVVYEAYDPHVFHTVEAREAARVAAQYKITNPFLLFVSTIQPRKNIVRLIEAFSRIDTDAELILAGKPGWKNEEIYASPKKFGVADRVRFLGHIPDPDLNALMNAARALVYPSLFEGFGLEILEAMACGTPVITSNVSSMPEIAGDAGLLVDPYNVQDIADACERVLSDEELHRSLREKGFARAAEFSWEKAARETLAVFERVGGMS